MRALSIQQPFAKAIVDGEKPIENRVWRPRTIDFPARILIHAGRLVRWEDVERVCRLVAAQQQREPDAVMADYRRGMPTGAIVGAATMTGYVRDSPDPWFFGPYGFELIEPIAFQPIPCRGMLNFFQPEPAVVELAMLRDTLHRGRKAHG